MMARRRKRRSSRKDRLRRLKDNFYKATIVGIVYDPEGKDLALKEAWEDAADAASRAGISEAQLKRLVEKALEDAKEIDVFLDEHPDMLVKIEGQGWIVDAETEA